jgi:hypothetical protein
MDFETQGLVEASHEQAGGSPWEQGRHMICILTVRNGGSAAKSYHCLRTENICMVGVRAFGDESLGFDFRDKRNACTIGGPPKNALWQASIIVGVLWSVVV